MINVILDIILNISIKIKKLENVYGLLNDDESRMVFASRIKSIIEGDNGYIRRSKFAHYFHPEVMIQKGDTILDGGVSGDIDTINNFVRHIGDKGHIYAFEPEPVCYSQAKDKVKNINNVQLIPYGLYDKLDIAIFKVQGGASYVTDVETDKTITCHMTTVDTVATEYDIKKVDITKLDIEDSEMKALKGGVKTIKKYRPKLLISVYHKWLRSKLQILYGASFTHTMGNSFICHAELRYKYVYENTN